MPKSNVPDRRLNIDPDEVEFVITRLRLLQQQAQRSLTSEAGSHLIHTKFDSMVTAALDLELLLDQHTEYPKRTQQ